MLFALAGVVFILVWMLLIRKLIAPFLINIHPFLSMLLYNSALFFGLYMLSAPLNGKARWKMSLITFFVILGIQVISAPYLVSYSGVINQNIELWYLSADAGFGSLFSLFLPKFLISTFTYIITPILLFLILPIIILAPKQVAKMFGH